MRQWFRTGRSVMVVATAWSIFDALLHVAIDEIDLLRMATRPPDAGSTGRVPTPANTST